MYTFRTHGTCSSAIDFDIEEGKVMNVRFHGGCSGNTQGVARLVEGMEVQKVISLLSGIRCGYKSTSCPDQLAQALKMALQEKAARKDETDPAEKAAPIG